MGLFHRLRYARIVQIRAECRRYGMHVHKPRLALLAIPLHRNTTQVMPITAALARRLEELRS